MAYAGLLTGCLTRACGVSERQCAHGAENTDSRRACARRLFSRAWRSLSGTVGGGVTAARWCGEDPSGRGWRFQVAGHEFHGVAAPGVPAITAFQPPQSLGFCRFGYWRCECLRCQLQVRRQGTDWGLGCKLCRHQVQRHLLRGSLQFGECLGTEASFPVFRQSLRTKEC
jgi:hypothetical protein